MQTSCCLLSPAHRRPWRVSCRGVAGKLQNALDAKSERLVAYLWSELLAHRGPLPALANYLWGAAPHLPRWTFVWFHLPMARRKPHLVAPSSASLLADN